MQHLHADGAEHRPLLDGQGADETQSAAGLRPARSDRHPRGHLGRPSGHLVILWVIWVVLLVIWFILVVIWASSWSSGHPRGHLGRPSGHLVILLVIWWSSWSSGRPAGHLFILVVIWVVSALLVGPILHVRHVHIVDLSIDQVSGRRQPLAIGRVFIAR